jgi:hypothetical protein
MFTDNAHIRGVAVLGNHLPRRCGIATFTTHLTDGVAAALPDADCFVLAMNDAGRRYPYPARVRFEIAEGDIASYRRAADFLNVAEVDVVSVQHEYGIFSGKAGGHVLTLLGQLRMPIVTTLHTILAEPGTADRPGRAVAALGTSRRHERAGRGTAPSGSPHPEQQD